MNYYNEIKNELLNNEINRKVKKYSINRSDLNTYYNVGRMLCEAGKHYGEGIIKEYSIKLSIELNKTYSYRSLNYMIKFYQFQNLQSVTANLSWGHWIELLSIKDTNKIRYYIKISEIQCLTTRQLREKIKSNEYERLDDKAKQKLLNKEESNVVDFVKNPIHIKNSYSNENISEKLLQKLILEDISTFMRELGLGFSFVANEYRIKLGDRYNYIDLLLYNFIYKCFVVIELKVTDLNSNHTGQIQKYMNYIDINVKRIDDNKTVGIIICKKNNQYIIDYCSDKRIIAREYELV